jgi:aminocarboxymuconate-semialdehyde decarboxylase
MYFDAISYHEPALECGLSFLGPDRLVFGTDHPFFPPKLVHPQTDIDAVPWPSTTTNQRVIHEVAAHSGRREIEEKILWKNAVQLLAKRP